MNNFYEKIGTDIRTEIKTNKFVIKDMRIFGSCARGDDTPDSDIDLYIELSKTDASVKKKVSRFER